jgi:hypothetical protein
MRGDNNEAILLNTFQSAFGAQAGNLNLTGTSPSGLGSWSSFQVISDTATIASITMDGIVNTSWSGFTLPAGMIVYGQITNITLSTGYVRLYGTNQNPQ